MVEMRIRKQMLMEVLAGDANANVDMKVSQDGLWCTTHAYTSTVQVHY